MKKLILIVIVLFGFSNYAQEKTGKGEKNKTEQMSPEQKSQLQLKKMTLALDLNESQQKEMSPIISDMNSKRASQKATMQSMKAKGEKPTAEQQFEMQNNKLNDQIAMKEKVSKILTPKQFEKWEQMQQNKGEKSKKGKNNKPNKNKE